MAPASTRPGRTASDRRESVRIAGTARESSEYQPLALRALSAGAPRIVPEGRHGRAVQPGFSAPALSMELVGQDAATAPMDLVRRIRDTRQSDATQGAPWCLHSYTGRKRIDDETPDHSDSPH